MKSQFPFGFGAAGHPLTIPVVFKVGKCCLNSLSGLVLPVTAPKLLQGRKARNGSQFPFGFGAAGHVAPSH